MMLHNGVDPTQTEGMSVQNSGRAKGMTPLEAFQRDIAKSPWRSHEQIGPRFDRTAKAIHRLLEQGERAMQLKLDGNRAFAAKDYATALEHYSRGRVVWEEAKVRGHHTAVLLSNAAKCHRKLGEWSQCKEACGKGLEVVYCSPDIRRKLEATLAEAKEEEQREADAVAEGKSAPPAPAVVEKVLAAAEAKRPGTKL